MNDAKSLDIRGLCQINQYFYKVPDVLVVPFEYPDSSFHEMEVEISLTNTKKNAYSFIFDSLSTGESLELLLMEEFDFHPTQDQWTYIYACSFLASQIYSELSFLGLVKNGVCLFDFYTRTEDVFVLLRKDHAIKNNYPIEF